jgi:hypothetical protein
MFVGIVPAVRSAPSPQTRQGLMGTSIVRGSSLNAGCSSTSSSSSLPMPCSANVACQAGSNLDGVRLSARLNSFCSQGRAAEKEVPLRRQMQIRSPLK